MWNAPQEDWLEKVGPFIQARIERYAQSEIRFNLMAVIRARPDVLSEQLAALERKRAALLASQGRICSSAKSALSFFRRQRLSAVVVLAQNVSSSCQRFKIYEAALLRKKGQKMVCAGSDMETDGSSSKPEQPTGTEQDDLNSLESDVVRCALHNNRESE